MATKIEQTRKSQQSLLNAIVAAVVRVPGVRGAAAVPLMEPGRSRPDGQSMVVLTDTADDRHGVAVAERWNGGWKLHWQRRGRPMVSPKVGTVAAAGEWATVVGEDLVEYANPYVYDPRHDAKPAVVETSPGELTHALARVSVWADPQDADTILAMLAIHLPGYAEADVERGFIKYKMTHSAPGRYAYVVADPEVNLPEITYTDS